MIKQQILKNRRLRLQVTGNSPFSSVQSSKIEVNWHKVLSPKSRLNFVKYYIGLALSLTLLAATTEAVWAQFDPSSSLLLKPGRSSTAPTLDSSRYKIRNPESRKDDDLEETPGTMIPSPVPRNAREAKAGKAKKETPVEPAPTEKNETAGADSKSSTETKSPTPETNPAATNPPEPPPVTLQVKHLILGGTDEDIEEYRNKIQPEDPRANILSVSIAPAYHYMASSSSYSYRDYNTQGPGFGFGMNVWLTPFLGVQSKYFSSLAGSVRDGVNTVSMSTQEFEAGIRFRKHFGYTLKSPQLLWGIDYHDLSNNVSREATTVVGRKTSGLGVVVEATLPSTGRYSHTFDVALRPYQRHLELPTAADAKSGTKNETHSVSLGIGGVWTLDRQNQIFWKGQYEVERSLYGGDATAADSHGNTPNGVGVTNSLMIFYFGFRWGS
jgi:hypothetical protein